MKLATVYGNGMFRVASPLTKTEQAGGHLPTQGVQDAH